MASGTPGGDSDLGMSPTSTSSLFVVDDSIDDIIAASHPRHQSHPRSPPNRSEAYYRDLYKDRLDFRALARDDPDFAAVLHHGQLDFRDPAAVMQLTETLLRRDFGLALDLPPDRLCPPVPNRHSYVLWLKGLLDSTTASTEEASAAACVGLDVGTGASCIYPLLGCAQRPAWRFLATDVDAASLQHARANVERNGLAERIRVVARSPEDPLVPVGDQGEEGGVFPPRLDFVMVNPPFYASADEMAATAAAKQQPPNSVCTGAPVEMVYAGEGEAGGEVAFVGRILAESAVLRDRVGWYTAMLGKLASLVALVGRLRAQGVDNYAVAAFVHGNKTRRWALGWSYGARRPTVAVARGGGPSGSSTSGGGGGGGGGSSSHGFESYRHILPPITEVDVWSVPAASGGKAGDNSSNVAVSVTTLSTTIDTLMHALELASWVWDGQNLRGVGRARENVWGRAWRRKKLREEKERGGETAMIEEKGKLNAASSASGPDEECAFGFVVTIRLGVAETTVGCRWLEGHNEAVFQSFCGFLKTKLKESASTTASNPAQKSV